MVSSSEVSGEVPGLLSVASAIRHAVAAHRLDRRLLMLADEIERAGQNDGDGAGLGHGRHAVFVGIFEMVRRQRAESRGECRAMQVGELIGVQTKRQAERLRFCEYLRGLFHREGDAFAEGVDHIGETLGGDRRQHFVADRIDIAGLVAGHLRRELRARREMSFEPISDARRPSRRAACSWRRSVSSSRP